MIKDKVSLVSGIILILFSILIYYESSQLSPFGSVFPLAITTALLILSLILIFRSFKFEIKVVNQNISLIKIPLLVTTFFAWIYFIERTGFILTSLIAFNLLIIINSENNTNIAITEPSGMTLRWAGNGTPGGGTGSRSLLPYGMATIYFMQQNTAIISGAGLS